jgi:hypothetical protein
MPTPRKRRRRLQTRMTRSSQLRRRFQSGPTSSGPCCRRGCRPHSIRVGPRIEIARCRVSDEPRCRARPLAALGAPRQPPGINIRSRAATTQNTNLQPAGPQAMRNAWLPPLTVGQPYAQANGGELQYPWSVPIAWQAAGIPPTLSARPLADSNFVLANAGDAAVRQAQQQAPLQNKQTQQQIPASPPGRRRPIRRLRFASMRSRARK